MSELGEISSEVREALARLDRVSRRFAQLDRGEMADLEAGLSRSPRTRAAAALIGRARNSLRQAQAGATAARRSGAEWLSRHGSGQQGGSGGRSAAPEPRAAPEAGSGSPPFSSPAAEAAWSIGFATPGGRAYFPASEPDMVEAAKALSPFPGEYTLDAHGGSDRVEVGGHRLGGAEVAELIRADDSWGGRPVRLFSCATGSGQRPVAADVADELGVRVTAPVDVAWSDASGACGVGPVKVKLVDGVVVEVPDGDGWRVFDPDPKG